MTVIRVVVADDQKVVRDGLALLLGLMPDIEVVGVAGDGEQALERVAAHRPDLVLTTYADDDSVFAALRAGARGFLTKDAGAEDIAQALAAVREGEAQLDPSVQLRLVEALAAREPARRAGGLPDGLTRREGQVLGLIAEGRSNAEIARELFISETTVKTHINNLFAKAGLRDRAQAVGYAFRHGFASPR